MTHLDLMIYASLLLTLFFSAPKSFAQQTSAGSVLQGIRSQELETTLPQVVPNIDRTKVDQTSGPKAATFLAKRFVFIGNTKVSSETLNTLVAGYLNRPITFNDLKNAADLIAEYYRAQGLLVKTQIPQQDVTEGVVTIEVMEASLGGILIDNKSKRVSDARVEKWIYSAIPRNTSLSLSALDRALLTLNDLQDIQVTSSLQEGGKRGETNVLLTVTDKLLVDGMVGVDNFGQSSTGQNRATANLNINGPFGQGEQVNVYGLHTEGTNYGRVALTAPIGSDGLRVGINGSYLAYRVVNSSFNQLFANGTSTTGGAELTYPIIRSRPANLFLLTNYNYSNFINNANSAITSQYSTSVFLGGLSGNLLDGFAGGGINSGSLIASGGSVNLNNSPSLSSDVIGPQVNGNFTKLRYAANRIQAITSSLSAYLGASGQIANKNLDPSEQLYLGGPYSVRAYATGQGNASQGNLMTFELRQALPMKLLLTGFYDYANVQTYKTTNFTSAPQNNTYALQGLGSSIGWSGPMGLQIKAIWAMRTGTLPSLVTQSFNGNGGTSSNRFWLTASLPI
jgi:hemolysin activation/secretion protein